MDDIALLVDMLGLEGGCYPGAGSRMVSAGLIQNTITITLRNYSSTPINLLSLTGEEAYQRKSNFIPLEHQYKTEITLVNGIITKIYHEHNNISWNEYPLTTDPNTRTMNFPDISSILVLRRYLRKRRSDR